MPVTTPVAIRQSSGNGTELADPVSNRPDVWQLLSALRRCWLPATVVGVLVAGLIGSGVFLLLPSPPQTAKAVIRIYPRPKNRFFQIPDGQGSDTFRSEQIREIRRRSILAEALRDPAVARLPEVTTQAKPVEWLERELKVSGNLGPQFISVSLKNADGNAAKKIVNAVVQAYLKQASMKQESSRWQRLDDLRSLKQWFDDTIRTAQKRLDGMKQAIADGDGEKVRLERDLLMTQVKELKTQLITLQSAQRDVEAEIATQELLRSDYWAQYTACLLLVPASRASVNLTLGTGLHISAINPNIVDEATIAENVTPIVKDHPKLKELDKEIAYQKEWISAFERTRGPNAESDRYVQQKDKLQKLLKQRKAALASIRAEVTAKLKAENDRKIAAKIIELNRRKADLVAKQRVLGRELLRILDESQQMARNTMPTVGDQADREKLRMLENFRSSVASMILKMETEVDAPPRVELDQEAIIYSEDDTRRRIMLTGAASVGSLGAVLFAFAWFEFRRKRLFSPKDLANRLGIQLVGTLPDHRRVDRRNARGPGQHYPDSTLVDSIDAIRTMILFTSRMESLRVLLVTSAVAGEGKTTAASHLATSLARAGYRVVLIDGDLRKPALQDVFDLPLSPGFCDLLRNEATLDQVRGEVGIPGLNVITAGAADFQAVQLVQGDRCRALLNSLRSEADFVLIDSPPVLPVPDTLNLSQCADGVIFSVLRGVSTYHSVHTAYERLSKLNVRILGAIFAGSTASAYYDSYSYEYGS